MTQRVCGRQCRRIECGDCRSSGQVETLRDNVVTLATSSYSGYHSSTTGNGYQYNYSGTNKDEIKDDRDLRTSDTTALDF